MKKYTVIFISVLLLAPFMAKMLFTTAFYINQDSIAQELCVQRSVSNNSCKGACYLKKKLDQLDDTTKSKDSKSEKSYDEKSFFTSEASFCFIFESSVSDVVLFDSYRYCIAHSPEADVFHPPSV